MKKSTHFHFHRIDEEINPLSARETDFPDIAMEFIDKSANCQERLNYNACNETETKPICSHLKTFACIV